MGKKRNKKLLSKWDFQGMCCKKCMLCRDGAEPSFCYQHVYKQNPQRFIQKIFPKLLDAQEQLLEGDFDYQADPEKEMSRLFNFVFGAIGFQNRKTARAAFAEQITDVSVPGGSLADPGGAEVPVIDEKQLSKKERRLARQKRLDEKRNKRYVVAAYPTFFCNASFREEVNSILADKNQQQDPADEPYGGIAANPGKQAAATKS